MNYPRIAVVLVCTLIAHALTSELKAQPSLLPAEPAHPSHWDERHTTAVPMPVHSPSFDVGHEHFLVTQFLLGTQTGFRIQLACARECDLTWTTEVFLGVAATTYGLGGAVGVGGRVHYTVMSNAWNDVFLVSPGLSLVLQGDDHKRGSFVDPGPDQEVLFLAPSVDFTWLHDFAPHFGWEAGVNLGVGIGLSGLDHRGDKAAGKLTPLFGVHTGLRF